MSTITSLELAGDDSPRVCYVLVFEGINLAITNTNDISRLATRWDIATEWSNFRPGLIVGGVIQQRAQPYESSIQMPELNFDLRDDDDNYLARLMFREANSDAVTEKLAGVASASLDNDDTAMVLDDSAGLPASGTVYMGTEEIEFAANGGSGTLLGLTRGIRSIFGTKTDGDHFGQQHRITHETDPADSFRPEASSHPKVWVGRAVALYLCVEIDGVWTAGVSAEMVWAGTIRKLEDQDGAIHVECDSILKRLEQKLLRRQYRGYLQEGVYLSNLVNGHFRVTVARTTAGGGPSIWSPAAVNLLSSAGIYTAADIATLINTQLAVWFDGTTTYFDDDQTLVLDLMPGDGGDFYEFQFQDTQAGDYIYVISVQLNPVVLSLLGITNYISSNRSSTYQVANLSENPGLDPSPPLGVNYHTLTAESPPTRTGIRTPVQEGAPSSISVTRITGEYIRQPTIPSDGGSSSWNAAEAEAFFRIGGRHIVAVKETATDTYEIHGSLGLEFENLGIAPVDGSRLLEGVEFTTIDGANVDGVLVEQVWFETGAANDIFTRLLISTGVTDYNDNGDGYDVMPEQMGLGLPWRLVDLIPASTTDIPDGIGAADYVLFIARPTEFLPLFESALQVRNLHAFFHRGAIRVTGFGETDTATLQITVDQMGRVITHGQTRVPAADPLRAARTRDYLINEVKLNYNIPFGSVGNRKPSTLTVTNESSKSDLRIEAGVTVDAIGFYDGVDIIGTGTLLADWQTDFAAPAMAYFGRPLCEVPIRFDLTVALDIYPGQVVLLTHPSILHPATGERGVTDLPCWVVASATSYGTGLGEALLLFQPEAVTAP